jgi:hypothetical protein
MADRLSAGLVCYLNPATLEIIDIPQAIADTMMLKKMRKTKRKMRRMKMTLLMPTSSVSTAIGNK